MLDAAAAFLREALSTFEIAHRGYHEVQEVARVEHEHVTQLRALADASVRINAAATTEDTLQQTVDAAREVLGARQATITSSAGDPFARRLSAAAPAGGAGGEVGPPLGVMLRSAGRPLGMLEVRDVAERGFSPATRRSSPSSASSPPWPSPSRRPTRASATSPRCCSAPCCRRR